MPTYEVTDPNATHQGQKIVVRVRAKTKFVYLRMSANDALELLQAIQRALIVSAKPRNEKR